MPAWPLTPGVKYSQHSGDLTVSPAVEELQQIWLSPLADCEIQVF